MPDRSPFRVPRCLRQICESSEGALAPYPYLWQLNAEEVRRRRNLADCLSSTYGLGPMATPHGTEPTGIFFNTVIVAASTTVAVLSGPFAV